MNVMAVSPSSSTEETTNACRAYRLLLGPCTDQMRDVLRHHVPPSTFPQVINKKISNLPRLTAPQLNLIFPRGSTYSGNYNDMDISLLYTLLRNICSIPPHRKGWGNNPDPTDRSLSANIERIRIARNQCVHSSSPVLSNSDFITIWSTVKSAVVDLDVFLNNGNQYERKVDILRQVTMDPVYEGHYIEELRKQVEEDEPTREKVHDLERKLEEIDADRIGNQSQMLRMIDNFSNAVIPPNVRAVYDIDVSSWRENDEVFYECENFPAMLEKVKNQTHVTFVGVPGSGKTATARHIALMLQEEGYEIVPIKEIGKIEDYCDPNNPQVFVIDDVVGVFGLQKAKLNLLHDYQDRISRPVMQNSKTLMTCREAVYRKSFESSSFFTNENNIILLHSKDNILTNSDKINLLKMYNINYNMFSTTHLSSTSKMFPYLCKLFSSEKKFQSYGTVFFENPVPCILKELEEMKKQNKIQYASLVLCMMNENKISKNILEETNKEKVTKSFQEMRKRVLWKCKVSSETNNYKFVDALSAMEGTYTRMYGTEYSFVHDSMFEVLAYHFGCQFPELILQYMSSSYIANNVKLHHEHSMQNLESEHKQASENIEVCGECKEEEGNVAFNSKSRENMESFDLYIRLREDQYSMLTERLYKDVENMELCDVFMNDTLKERKVCKSFIEVLKTKSYTVLKSLFLSVQRNVFKVVSKKERLDKESEGRIGKMKWPRQRFMTYRDMRGQEILVNEKKKEYKVRVISWVIYYGHNQILQFILEQTDLHKETQSELFTNSLNPELSLITEEGEVNKNIEQYRLLVLSCYSGYLEIVRKILKHFNRSINLRALTNFNYEHCIYDTPLTVACMEGHINIVQELIEEGADINHQGEYNTPLTAACEGGHIRLVKELIKAGADINLRGEINTPLVTACECGHKSLVTELIEMGADVNPSTQFDSPLTTACVGGEMSFIKELIKAGADVNPQGKYNTPLKKACFGGDLSLVKMLIEAGADVNLQDRSGPPLTACCDDRHLSIVKELLKAGADVNQQGRFYSPLGRACTNGQIEVVKTLLEKGANINTDDNLGRTPLYLTILNEPENLIPVIQILNKYGADSSICNKKGLSSLYIALLKHKNDVVNQVLRVEDERQLYKSKLHLFECLVYIRQRNVTTDCRDYVVTTQKRILRMEELGDLCRIIRENKCDELKHLLDVGLDVNQQIQLYNDINFEGFTSTYESDVRPLLFTLIDEKRVSDKVGKVMTLLERGADVNIRVKYRESDFVLDREGVSILEKIRQLMNRLRESEYWWETKDVTECERMLSEVKKHVRRYSV